MIYFSPRVADLAHQFAFFLMYIDLLLQQLGFFWGQSTAIGGRKPSSLLYNLEHSPNNRAATLDLDPEVLTLFKLFQGYLVSFMGGGSCMASYLNHFSGDGHKL